MALRFQFVKTNVRYYVKLVGISLIPRQVPLRDRRRCRLGRCREVIPELYLIAVAVKDKIRRAGFAVKAK